MSSKIRVTRICQFCENEFEARTTVTKTCSDLCAKRLYKLKLKEAKLQYSNAETQMIRNKPLTDLQAKEFLNIEEACKLLGVSRRTLYRFIQDDRLKIGKVRNRTVIKKTEIEKIFA
ncbi:helix-turn-helix domain-containing protein [Flavihumibacter profundi]|uniref:helix-turn-helix domain-containing protein n=1 Tax=Flavihumibacter profundi TaxID=2716883 RepID=UPI001CC741C7|nr:helix-turn-helix domain-containing protein [Flavihumibacter profundi]MBZ5859453.1 helix-turn-helix domain-containing protein [Flavihumibacter profundi]